jgi:hypothetical protein
MIGVAVPVTQRETAVEFFELFKTPWEFYRSGQRYDVLICTQQQFHDYAAKLTLIYNPERTSFDHEFRIPISSCKRSASLAYNGQRLPLYGKAATFPANRFSALKEGTPQEFMALTSSSDGRVALRIGYDLFDETRLLLTAGQPPANARTPTLELHIALLRDLITGSGIPLVEIPPVPDGYNFITCLTHDIDHPVLRNHFCDHTMFGFLYRATVGSLVLVCRGRKPARGLWQNWAAGFTLPLLYLGVAKDPWLGFDRYLEIESGLGTTYFVIPKKHYPGRDANGGCLAKRGASYTIGEIRPQLERIVSAGNEVGLHGIDAWLDSASGCEESAELFRVLGGTEAGVRMHWLLSNEQSPAALDQAGFSYDSSFGYNETVGYRAGTAQAFKPIGAANMLELPLHIMDTALFLPKRLELREAEAEDLVRKLIEGVERFGGALTINWHDRSIAPERLWDAFYLRLLSQLKRRGAWFPTASQAVSWFKKRRAAAVEATLLNGSERIKIKGRLAGDADALPGLRIRVHKPRTQSLLAPGASQRLGSFVDVRLDKTTEMSIAL